MIVVTAIWGKKENVANEYNTEEAHNNNNRNIKNTRNPFLSLYIHYL